MTLRLSTALRNALVDATEVLIDTGSGQALLEVYTGSGPAGPDASATGTKLLSFSFQDPAFGAASSGSATMDSTPAMTTTGLANGTAGWFRILNPAGAAVIDGTVGTDLTLSSNSITTGLSVQITSGTLTAPAS